MSILSKNENWHLDWRLHKQSRLSVQEVQYITDSPLWLRAKRTDTEVRVASAWQKVYCRANTFASNDLFLSICAVIDASTKSKQRDKDEKCVFSVKHDPQNEAPTHHDKKRSAESFIFLSFCTRFCTYSLTHSLSARPSRPIKWKIILRKDPSEGDEGEMESAITRALFIFSILQKEHILVITIINSTTFVRLFSLTRVAGVLNFICFIWIIHTTTTTPTCSVCYKMFMDETKELKSVGEGLTIINWILKTHFGELSCMCILCLWYVSLYVHSKVSFLCVSQFV